MLSAPHLVEVCREDPAIGIAYKSEFKSFVFELIYLIWREENGPLELVFWIITSGQPRAIGTVGEEGLGYGGVRRFRYTVVKKWLKRRIGTPRIKLENSLMPIWLLDLSSPIPGMVPANWARQSQKLCWCLREISSTIEGVAEIFWQGLLSSHYLSQRLWQSASISVQLAVSPSCSLSRVIPQFTKSCQVARVVAARLAAS